ncbi:restriction endonuclease HpaII [Flavobacterium beibuense F44-8]|uniref:Very short patch repair endonuclease n=1 Tax=Flavobacterium beibuense F44-8 TaxID=1406840 RepID=A0A0A2LV16_9FLAO|nr:very short patch repair endonuclease [Flavobacterium beibuense]KGO83151.1 restriction endonuclease HpaII [Flavobacterium beibuense F44-8]
MDRHTPEQRSRNMAAIKSKATKDEVLLGKAMWYAGLRYRKNTKTVFGKPDFTFKKYKLAVFVDSEFFHGKNWETEKYRIKTNQEFWHKKIEKNIERDKEVNEYLISQGWTVLRFWSKEIRKNLDEVVNKIQAEIIQKSNIQQ